MSVFKQCKDKSLVSLIGASDSYSQGVQNLVMGFVATVAVASTAASAMAGVNGPQWAQSLECCLQL